MDRIPQEFILGLTFNRSIEREELLLKKYEDYIPQIRDKELLQLLKDFKKTSQEHIAILKEKMSKLQMQ